MNVRTITRFILESLILFIVHPGRYSACRGRELWKSGREGLYELTWYLMVGVRWQARIREEPGERREPFGRVFSLSKDVGGDGGWPGSSNWELMVNSVGRCVRALRDSFDVSAYVRKLEQMGAMGAMGAMKWELEAS